MNTCGPIVIFTKPPLSHAVECHLRGLGSPRTHAKALGRPKVPSSASEALQGQIYGTNAFAKTAGVYGRSWNVARLFLFPSSRVVPLQLPRRASGGSLSLPPRLRGRNSMCGPVSFTARLFSPYPLCFCCSCATLSPAH